MRALEWLGGLLLAAALLLYGFGSVETLRWLAVYGGFALAAGVFAYNCKIRLRRADIALLALFCWGVLSLFWSNDPRTGIYSLINGAALIGVYFLARYGERVIPWAVFLSVIAAIVLLMMQPQWNGGFGNPNFSTEFLLLSSPFVLWWALDRKEWGLLSVPVLILVVAGLFIIPSKIEYAVCFALAVFTVWWAISNRCHKEAWWLIICIVGGMAAILSFTDMPVSIMARAEIGLNTLALWSESPIWGHGMGAFGFGYDRVREFHLGFIDSWAVLGAAKFVGAAHNEYLQLLADLGIIGLGLFGAFVWFLIQDTSPLNGRESVDRVFSLVVLLIAAILALIGFPMQNPWTAVLIAIAAGTATRGGKVVFSTRAAPVGYAAVCLAIGLGVIGVKSVKAQHELAVFRVAAGQDTLLAFRKNLAAYEIFPLDRYARMHLALTLAAVTADYKDRLKLSPEAADKVYDISRTAAGYMPAVLIARGQYLVNSQRYDEPELEAVLDRLKEYSANIPEAWLLDAWVGLIRRDIPRIQRSLDTMKDLTNTRAAHIEEAERILAYLQPKEE
jgi:hypothetical protein